jgi:hypothetical protein
MDKLLQVASLLDNLGSYVLSDKLYKISQSNMPDDLSNTKVMDASQYYDNPYTPKDILKLRNKLAPTNFRDEIRRVELGNGLLASNNPSDFVMNLFEFARKNKLSNSLADAFDIYSDSGATYNGQNINSVPELVELYKRVIDTPVIITRQMLESELRNIFRSKLGMSGSKFESGPNSWKRNYDSSSGADIGYLEQEYMQNLDYASESDLLFLEKEINNDQYLNDKVREKLLKEVDKKKFVKE